MASVDLELQRAIKDLLRADDDLRSVIGKGVYDNPPASAKLPYITIGESQIIRDDLTCVDGQICYLTLHAWSGQPGFPEVKRIADRMVDLLHLAAIDVVGFRLVSLMHRNTRNFRDADGVTSHAVIEFVANTEKLTA